MQTMLPVITFIAISGVFIFFYLHYEAGKKNAWIKTRLQSSLNRAGPVESRPLLKRILPALGSYIVPSKEQEISQIRETLSYAGYREGDAFDIYFGIRAFLALSLSMLFILFLVISGRSGLVNIFLTTFPLAVGYYLPPVILRSKVKSRNKKIFRELPDTLDLLIICIEAGLGFEMALFRVSKELKDVAPVLSKEFAQYFFETRGGVARNEALDNLKARNGDFGLKAVIDVVIQSIRFGTDITHALRVHSDSMRTERRQIAEEKGAKVAVKLTFPMILFILPVLLIIILGPAITKFARAVF